MLTVEGLPGWAALTEEQQASVKAEGPFEVLPPHEAKARAFEEKAERDAFKVRPQIINESRVCTAVSSFLAFLLPSVCFATVFAKESKGCSQSCQGRCEGC